MTEPQPLTVFIRCTHKCPGNRGKARCMLETVVNNEAERIELIDHKNFGGLFTDCDGVPPDAYRIESISMHESPKGDVKRDRSFECQRCDRRCILSYDDEDMDLDPFFKCPFGMKGSFFKGDMNKCDMEEL